MRTSPRLAACVAGAVSLGLLVVGMATIASGQRAAAAARHG
jgi:hypothetical protein